MFGELARDTADASALELNAQLVAGRFKRKELTPQRIARVSILHDMEEHPFEFDASMHHMAVFIDAYQKVGRGPVVSINKKLIKVLTRYIGENVLRSLADSTDKEHKLINCILANEGGHISIGYKKKEPE